MGCFVDATFAVTARSAVSAVSAAIDARDAVVLYGDWQFLDYHVGPVNVIMSRSGYGVGCYPTYVGIDAHDEVVCFVTDFGVLDDGEGDNATE